MFHDSHEHPCTLFFDSFHYMLTGRYIWYIGICSLFAGEGYGPAPSIQSFQTKWQRAFLVGCIKLNMQIYFYQSNYTRSSFTGALTINRGHIISCEGKKTALYLLYTPTNQHAASPLWSLAKNISETSLTLVVHSAKLCWTITWCYLPLVPVLMQIGANDFFQCRRTKGPDLISVVESMPANRGHLSVCPEDRWPWGE